MAMPKKTINTIHCYSGGRVMHVITLTESLSYEPDDNGFSISDGKGIVFVWNGTYAVINSSFNPEP